MYSTSELQARKKASVFKPAIDESILKIATWAGVDTDRVESLLDSLNANRYSAFEYLYTAMRKVKSVLFIERVEAQMKFGWSKYLFNNPEQQHLYVGESEYDYDPSDLEAEDYAVVLENYPDKAHAALKQNRFWGGHNADVVGIWVTKEGIERVFHANAAAFNILGEDAIDFIEKIVENDFSGDPAGSDEDDDDDDIESIAQTASDDDDDDYDEDGDDD